MRIGAEHPARHLVGVCLADAGGARAEQRQHGRRGRWGEPVVAQTIGIAARGRTAFDVYKILDRETQSGERSIVAQPERRRAVPDNRGFPDVLTIQHDYSAAELTRDGASGWSYELMKVST